MSVPERGLMLSRGIIYIYICEDGADDVVGRLYQHIDVCFISLRRRCCPGCVGISILESKIATLCIGNAALSQHLFE